MTHYTSVNAAQEFFMPQFSTDKYWDMVRKEEQRFCESNKSKVDDDVKLTLFPEDIPSELHGAAMGLIHPENISHIPNNVRRYVVGSVIACVTYRLKGLPNIYQTRTVYTLVHTDGTRYFEIGKCDLHPVPQSPMIFCEGGTPASQLRLIREIQGDDAY